MDETAKTSVYALDHAASPSFPALRGEHRADIAIIGGGLTGLSTALSLAEAGRDVRVLEAHTPGWGASGRNGGQLNPGLKYDPSEIVMRFGERRGRSLVDFAWSSVEKTGEMISRLGIGCDLRRQGTIRAAVKLGDVDAVRKSQSDMQSHGMPVEWLDKRQIAERTGHGLYQGGFLDRRGGDLNPLKYSLGLAGAASRAGARIHGNSRAADLRRDSGTWRITTAGGGVLRASSVLVCCNGYTDGLVPILARALVPVFSSVLASNPLPPDLAQRVMPGRQVLYESSLVTVYYRVDGQNRLIIGGRGPMKPISSHDRVAPVAAHAVRLWPELKSVGWQTAWNGRVAVTKDHLPHFHQLGDGLYAVYGYNGRGVALSSAIGEPLAGLLSGEIAPDQIPIPASPLEPIGFHRFWPLGVHATIAWSRAKNALSR